MKLVRRVGQNVHLALVCYSLVLAQTGDYDFCTDRVHPVSVPKYEADRHVRVKLVYNWRVGKQPAFEQIKQDCLSCAFILRHKARVVLDSF